MDLSFVPSTKCWALSSNQTRWEEKRPKGESYAVLCLLTPFPSMSHLSSQLFLFSLLSYKSCFTSNKNDIAAIQPTALKASLYLDLNFTHMIYCSGRASLKQWHWLTQWLTQSFFSASGPLRESKEVSTATQSTAKDLCYLSMQNLSLAGKQHESYTPKHMCLEEENVCGYSIMRLSEVKCSLTTYCSGPMSLCFSCSLALFQLLPSSNWDRNWHLFIILLLHPLLSFQCHNFFCLYLQNSQIWQG